MTQFGKGGDGVLEPGRAKWSGAGGLVCAEVELSDLVRVGGWRGERQQQRARRSGEEVGSLRSYSLVCQLVLEQAAAHVTLRKG